MHALEEARRLVADDDRKDFDFAERGFIATRKDPVIMRRDGRVAFDLSSYGFLEGRGAGDDQSQPVAPGADPDQAWPVQGRRPHLSGARL